VILVDTSVWIDYLRANKTPAVLALDRALSMQTVVAITEWIYLELLQGARSKAAFDKLHHYFSTQRVLKPTQGLGSYASTADLYRRCREQGITPRSTGDCLIAVIAIKHQIPLLHSDRDFERIATIESRLTLVKLTKS
jgi:hypothetical protein